MTSAEALRKTAAYYSQLAVGVAEGAQTLAGIVGNTPDAPTAREIEAAVVVAQCFNRVAIDALNKARDLDGILPC